MKKKKYHIKQRRQRVAYIYIHFVVIHSLSIEAAKKKIEKTPNEYVYVSLSIGYDDTTRCINK